MKLRSSCVSGFAALLWPWLAAAQEPASPLGDRIMQGAVVRERLWLRNDKGVAAVEDRDGRWIVRATDVLALERRGHALWLLSRPSASEQELLITEIDNDRTDRSRLALADGEKAVALLPADQPIVLSEKAIYRRVGGRWARTPIVDKGSPALVKVGVPAIAASTDGRDLYLAINRGEWGGELARIDVETGRRRRVAGGNFTALIADPQHPGCVIASRGVVHIILASGAVQRVCRGGATTLYSRPLTKAESEFPNNKEPVWALAPDGKRGFWAVGFSLHHFTADGRRADSPKPTYSDQGGVSLSRTIPGVVLVLTDSNRRFQVSGNTPLIIPE